MKEKIKDWLLVIAWFMAMSIPSTIENWLGWL